MQTPRKVQTSKTKSLLTGLLFDSVGNRFVPTHSTKNRKRYRYYTSQAVISGSKSKANDPTRLPAEEIENLVSAKLHSVLKSPQQMQKLLCVPNAKPVEIKRAMDRAKQWAPKTAQDAAKLIRALVGRIVVRDGAVELKLNNRALRTAFLGPNSTESDNHPVDEFSLITQADLKRCGGEVRLLLPPDDQTARNVPSLIKAVARAHDWVDQIMKGEAPNQRAIATELGVQKRYVGHIIRLAFLAPDITEAILDGTQQPNLNLQTLLPRLPTNWIVQRKRLSGLPRTQTAADLALCDVPKIGVRGRTPD